MLTLTSSVSPKVHSQQLPACPAAELLIRHAFAPGPSFLDIHTQHVVMRMLALTSWAFPTMHTLSKPALLLSASLACLNGSCTIW